MTWNTCRISGCEAPAFEQDGPECGMHWNRARSHEPPYTITLESKLALCRRVMEDTLEALLWTKIPGFNFQDIMDPWTRDLAEALEEIKEPC